MASNNVLELRDKLSTLWHAEAQIWWEQEHCGFSSADQYFAFCTAKDWIQDTSGVLMLHRQQGFSNEPHESYLEFWGLLQAIFIQQDAICELLYAFSGTRPAIGKTEYPAWHEIRGIRNLAVGHPTNKSGGYRSVTGRQGKSYNIIPLTVYYKWQARTEELNMGNLLDQYDSEATPLMEDAYNKLKSQLQKAVAIKGVSQ